MPNANIIAPLSNPSQIEHDANLLVERQTKQNISYDQAREQLKDSLYQGIAMVLDGRADALIAGSLRPTADVVRATLQCIGPSKGHKFVAGHFLIESDQLQSAQKTPFLFADCAVMPEPSPRALSNIARSAAESYRFFTGQTPHVSFLSFSTRGSAQHELVDRIREALKLTRADAPDLDIDGEVQLDAALNLDVARIKNASDSSVFGKTNIFIFPTLEAGNIGYKLVQRFSRSRIAGPLLWGLNKPVSDLSRGCTIQEIADTAYCVSMMAGGVN